MYNNHLTAGYGGQGWSCFVLDNQTLSLGEPPKSNNGSTPVLERLGEPFIAQFIAELDRQNAGPAQPHCAFTKISLN